MAPESQLRHYPDIISDHPLAKRGFASDLCALSERDSPRKGYFAETEIPALDMDAYERSRPGCNQKTCDAVTGVCYRHNNHMFQPKLILVELRMNYENIRNLSKTELTGKERHTCDLLSDFGEEYPTGNYLCLVFKPAREQEALNWVSRQKNGSSGIDHWKVFSPDSFCNFIGYGIKDPYEPDLQTSDIADRINAAAMSADILKLESEWEQARMHLTKCSQRYELAACRYLAEKIRNSLGCFSTDNLKDDEMLEFEILQEDITTAIRRHLSDKM